MNWINPITAIIDGVFGIFKKKQERKSNKEQAAAKLAQSKQANQHEVTLTDAEAEAILAEKSDSTWKDEYVTIIITFPLILIMAGVVHFMFTGDNRLLQAGIVSIQALTDAGVDMAFLMNAVVLAAIGLKVWRKS